jgi:hypothetical protein
MQFSFSALAGLIAAGLALWFWRDALRQRDRASHAAMETCTRLSLQFLDGTAAFSHWRFGREDGRWRLRRTYTFDYTAHSIERKQGFVVMLAGRVESVGFAGEHQRAPVQASPRVNLSVTFGPQSADTASGSSTDQSVGSDEPPKTDTAVFDLAAWRRDHPPRGRLH